MRILTLEQEVERGTKAKAIIQNELWIEVWEAFQKSIYEAWQETAVDQEAERQTLYLTDRICRKVRKEFEEAIETGKMAKMQIDNEQSKEATE